MAGTPFRIGMGYDVHRLVSNRPLILGGIEIPYHLGLLGHSDADVLIHAICDALLGAASLRDIGYQFPDASDAYAGIDSKIILQKTYDLISFHGYKIVNIDATIIAERPKLNPHIPLMIETLAPIMHISESCLSIKATTTEGLGFTGKGEGIAAQAVALIESI